MNDLRKGLITAIATMGLKTDGASIGIVNNIE